jgi:hypothetical protein
MHVNPHLFRWHVFNLDLSIVNFVFHKEIFHLDVLRTLAAGELTISF